MLVIPHLILKNTGKILLSRRSKLQKIWPNHWHCVTGTIEQGESPKSAIIREAKEEIGVDVNDLSLKATVYVSMPSIFNANDRFYAVELYFVCNLEDNQTPINLEPLKQDKIDWFDINELPKPLIPQVEFGIDCYFKNMKYAEYHR